MAGLEKYFLRGGSGYMPLLVDGLANKHLAKPCLGIAAKVPPVPPPVTLSFLEANHPWFVTFWFDPCTLW